MNRKLSLPRMRWAWLLASLLAAINVCYGSDLSVAAPAKPFNHDSTGFPLTGAHEAAACDSCHGRGVMKGTPTQCAGCHNGETAVGKGPKHLLTNAPCDTCHTTQSGNFQITSGFDHVGLTASCASCHADEQPSTHIPTPSSSDCSLCHRPSPFTFQNAPLFDHNNVSELRCDGCHDGTHADAGAVGKSSDHPPTQPGQDCGACHTTQSFAIAGLNAFNFDHTGITSGCNSCHAKDQTADHVPTPTGSECVLCHRIPPDTFASASSFNHDSVKSMRCDSCHNGSHTAAGATGKSTTHPPINAGQDCAACHNTSSFSDVALTSMAFDHTGVTSDCNSCHLSDKPATHLPVPPGSECILCHRVEPDVFSNAMNFSHSNLTSMRCDACHGGDYVSYGANGKSADHIATKSGQDCNTCHSGTSTFATGEFDHDDATTGCISCHAGDKPATHLPTPVGSECILCHRVAPDVFANAANFSHSNVSSMRCDACHTGAYVEYGANGKSPDHVATQPGQDCNACHGGIGTFATGTVDHSTITSGCSTCHAADKAATHLPTPTGSECVLCHRVAPDVFTNAANFNHSNVTSMRCDSCHSGSYTSYGANAKSSNHIATQPGQDCGACHTTGTFATGTVDHSTLTTGCSTCHAGDKAATHLPTPVGSECILCHRVAPDVFANAANFSHSNVSSMRCDACHTGAYVEYGANGKSPDHVATQPGQDCNACHSTGTFATGTVDHSTLTTGCSTCHAGDKAATHLPTPTGSECVLCHRVAPDVFTNAANFSHSNVTSMRCDSCHNGSYISYGANAKSSSHIATQPGQDCNACHSTGTFATGTVDHSTLTTGCSTCHAGDKAATHLPTPTGSECVLCHRVAPDVFTNAANFSHSNVTSMRCDSCHNGSYISYGATGKTSDHVATQPGQDCNACHTDTSLFAASAFDHTNVTSGCNSCHLSDKPATHLPVPNGAECLLCHRVAPDVFTNAVNFSHGNVTGMRCDACHTGTYVSYGAAGKSTDHIPTQPGQDCGACHTTGTFATGTVDHSNITTGCSTCHAGDKVATHLPVPTGAECVLCHRVAPDVFTNASNFTHSNVSSMRCDSCHNGSFVNYGANGKTATHIATQPGQDCKACHSSTSTFATGTFDHTNVTTGCNTCHLNDKPTAHLPVPNGSECVLCHRVEPDVFTSAANFTHGNVAGMRCDSCHNGSYIGYGALGKSSGHLATQPGQDCNACHTGTSNFANATYDHTNVTSGCNSCHAADKSATHLPVPTGSECVLCHRVAPDLFTNASNFSHSNVTGMRCDTCHNGSYVSYGANGKTATHIATQPGQDCKACHSSTSTFATGTFDHTNVTTGCNTCHLSDKPANHLPTPTGSQCILCHRVAPDVFTNAANFNHSNVTTLRCDSCHNGSYADYGAIGKSVGHIATQPGQDCKACHTDTFIFANAVFDHSGVATGCNSCHLSDKPANHLPTPTGSECVLCHRVAPDVFTNAANFSHSNVSTMRCDSCHSGAYIGYGAIGKTTTHPTYTAGQDCAACHTSTSSFTSVSVNHSTITTGCNNCHLTDKPATHLPVPSGSECVLCHRVAPDVFTIAANFNHSNVTSMRCDTCHNGSYVSYGALGKSAGHIATQPGQDCNACHTDTFNFANASFDHANVTTGCKNCHSVDKPANHLPVPTGSECILCHRVAPDLFSNAANFTHSKVSTMRCDTCHNGAFTGYGAIGKTSTHPTYTAGQDCKACHTSTATFTAVTVDHSAITTGCNNCHLTDKPANHLPVPTGSECVLCHRVAPDVFTNALNFNHSKVSTMRCDACHNGAYTAYGALGKPSAHPPVSAGQDCKACHTSTTSFATVMFSHSGVTTGCNNCHLSDKPASHIPVPAGSECILCHRVFPANFGDAANFSHTNLTSMRCDSCHNGAYTSYNAQGKPADHKKTPVGADCNATGCHRSTSSW